MPLQPDSGRDIRLLRNPTTGAFDSFDWDATSNPTFDDSDEHIVLSCIYESAYWANPQRSSKLGDIKLDRAGTDQQIKAAVEAALLPAISARQIRSATVQVTKRAPGSYAIAISYANRDGHRRVTRVGISS